MGYTGGWGRGKSSWNISLGFRKYRMWTCTNTVTRIMNAGGQDTDFHNIYASKLTEKEDTEPK